MRTKNRRRLRMMRETRKRNYLAHRVRYGLLLAAAFFLLAGCQQNREASKPPEPPEKSEQSEQSEPPAQLSYQNSTSPEETLQLHDMEYLSAEDAICRSTDIIVATYVQEHVPQHACVGCLSPSTKSSVLGTKFRSAASS